MPGFDEQYRSMTDDELLNLAKDSRDLTPEARSSLDSELSRRRITNGEVSSYEKERRNDPEDKRFNPKAAYVLWPALHRMHDTIQDWKQYRHQTGEWPRRSIGFYFLHLFVGVAVVLLTIWYSLQHGWSKGTFIVVLILLFALDLPLSNWLQNKIRLSEISRHRQAARRL